MEKKLVASKKDKPKPSREELPIERVLREHRGERHLVVLQNFPDPDAISCAFAHRLLSGAFGIEVDIVYSGRISHQQNIAMVKLLRIELLRYEESMDMKQYDGAIFVDNQGTTAGQILTALEEAEVPALMVVDHHDKQERLEPRFMDIRPTGATATIYCEYLRHGPVEIDGSVDEHVRAATALMHGILTDTGGFVRAGGEDFEAAAYLSRFRDADMLAQIMNQARSRQTMEITHLALGNRVRVESLSIAGIGFVRAEDRDAIPQAADFLLTEENVQTAIVYGIVTGDDHNERLIGSLRTSKITMDPDEFIKEVFGKDATGQYFGGGKLSAGGFEIPIGFLEGGQGEEFQETKWNVYDTQVKQKVFTKIGVEWPQEE